MNIVSPFNYSIDPHGSRLVMHYEENGGFYVDSNVISDDSPVRVRIKFHGKAGARVGDDADYRLGSSFAVVKLEKSPWLERFVDAYVKENGEGLRSVIDGLAHYVVYGHDGAIGVLARKVQISLLEEDAEK